jgi:hypothetical protein
LQKKQRPSPLGLPGKLGLLQQVQPKVSIFLPRTALKLLSFITGSWIKPDPWHSEQTPLPGFSQCWHNAAISQSLCSFYGAWLAKTVP